MSAQPLKGKLPYTILAALAVVPLLGLSSDKMHFLILVLIWSTIGMAWNLLGGYCGQVSFGHAAYFGVGAYTAGILYSKYGQSAWWGLPLGVVVAAVFAFVLGFIVLRLRGPFFALATLASGEVMRISAENWVTLTGGTQGILIQERTWVEKIWYFYIALAIAAVVFAAVRLITRSKLGYYFVAIREDQDAAESLGIDTRLYKTLALCLSAAMTGAAGAFYMNYMGYIDPHVVFALHDISIITIMVVMVGGVATEWGPFIGALIMVLLAEYIRAIPGLGAAHQTFFGVLLILIIIFLPNGIAGDAPRLLRRALKRGSGGEAGA